MDNWLIICNFVISRYLLLNSDYMAYLKEDGCLDMERIQKLPYDEYMYELMHFTKEHREEYFSALPINESKSIPIRKGSLKKRLESGCVIALDFLNNLRNKNNK